MKKVVIVNSDNQYDRMFKKAGWELVDSVEEADLVQFTGGADVTPELYGENNTASYSSVSRDLKDLRFFREALAQAKPMAGICRGGQFLNVMGGGKMVQHVDGHANGRQHDALDLQSGSVVKVTSTHHQMMVPGDGGQVLLTANIVTGDDTEAVYYGHIKALCFQPHPEFNEAAPECRNLYFKYLSCLFGLKYPDCWFGP